MPRRIETEGQLFAKPALRQESPPPEALLEKLAARACEAGGGNEVLASNSLAVGLQEPEDPGLLFGSHGWQARDAELRVFEFH